MSSKKSKKIKNVIIITGIVLVLGILIYQINEEGYFAGQFGEDYQTHGPLTIDKSKYLLGEAVYAWMTLHPLEDGEVTVYLPNGNQFYSMNFNGSLDPDPKFYFRVNLEEIREICVKEDVIGTWTVVITGKTLTEDQKNLTTVPKEFTFQYVDKILPDLEDRWNADVCRDKLEAPPLSIFNPGMTP